MVATFGLLALGLVAARYSIVAYGVVAVALLVLAAWATYRWPQAMLVVVVMTPIFDLYVFGALVPASVTPITRFFSEAMLGVVGAVITVRAIRAGTFLPAMRNPLTIPLLAFVALGAISALLNAVPPHVAAAGMIFTLEATALFYFALMAGFSRRQVVVALIAFEAAILIMALLGIAQMLLSPDILGRPALTGRFGETIRIGSFIGSDVGIFGVLVGMAIPFPLFAFFRTHRPAYRWTLAAVGFILMLALVLSFSRSSWLGVIVGFGTVALLVDRRVLLLAVVTGVLAFGTASVMPRGLLVPRAEGGGETTESPGAPEIVDSTVDRTQAILEGDDRRASFLVNAVPIVQDHPILGVGPGRYGGGAAHVLGSPVYEEYGTDRLLGVRQHAVDNFWLHIFVESGALGFVALAAGGLLLAVGLFRASRRAAPWAVVVIGGGLAAAGQLTVNAGGTMSLEANVCAFAMWFLLGLAGIAAGWPAHRHEAATPETAPAA